MAHLADGRTIRVMAPSMKDARDDLESNGVTVSRIEATDETTPAPRPPSVPVGFVVAGLGASISASWIVWCVAGQTGLATGPDSLRAAVWVTAGMAVGCFGLLMHIALRK